MADILWAMNTEKRNELLGLGGVGVDAFFLIEELEKKLNEITTELSKNLPMCPLCKKTMTPINFSHYYSEGSFPIWMCECEKEWPKSMSPENIHQGY